MIKLEEIKGVGPKTLKILNQLGIKNSNDLLEYYPFRYEQIKRSNIDELENDEKIIVDGIIETVPNVFHFNRKLERMIFKINSQNKLLQITIFNRGFLKKYLETGKYITVIGKYDKLHNKVVASDIRLGKIIKESYEPVYHTTYGLANKQINSYIGIVLKNDYNIEDYIPHIYIEKYHFLNKNESIRMIHYPTDFNILKKCVNRIKYEELFLFMLKMNYLKNNKGNKEGLQRIVEYFKVEEFIKTIPFKLTNDQQKSIEDIYDDLISNKRMNRLLQGDVGSGKTIVSVVGMYINYLSGYQSALMAPTEILAMQHYNSITSLFKNTDIKVGLLTGKLKVSEKKKIYKQIENNELDIIIGTHALFTNSVSYNNLGLVVTDEQHRFGVNQRTCLKNKGITPDILYMSATPIPRTYALTLYGDMDISSIKTVPRGRKNIITTIKKNKDMKEVLESILEQLKLNHQVYIIAPLIEESDKSDFENVYELEEKMKKAFGKLYNIGVLHGKLKNDEKDEVMNKFKCNDIQILISTTVVEVGVDVENATMMVIFDSYRFGLSALHQLRGRVGRNSLQSYCILISEKETERLRILTETNDGFKVSEEDFLIRGSGDVFGEKQSGDMVFRMADLKKDYSILLKAKADSEEFLSNKISFEDQKIMNLIENSMDLG